MFKVSNKLLNKKVDPPDSSVSRPTGRTASFPLTVNIKSTEETLVLKSNTGSEDGGAEMSFSASSQPKEDRPQPFTHKIHYLFQRN